MIPAFPARDQKRVNKVHLRANHRLHQNPGNPILNEQAAVMQRLHAEFLGQIQ